MSVIFYYELSTHLPHIIDTSIENPNRKKSYWDQEFLKEKTRAFILEKINFVFNLKIKKKTFKNRPKSGARMCKIDRF